MPLLVFCRGEGAPETLKECEWLLEHLADLQMSEHLGLERCAPPDGSEMFFLNWKKI